MKISFVFAVTSQKDRWTFLEDQECVDYYNRLNNETVARYKKVDQHRERFVNENPFINNVQELIDLIKNKPVFAQLTFSQYTGMFSNNVIINNRKSKHSKSSDKWGTFIKQQRDVFSNRHSSLSYSSPPNSCFFISHMDCTNHYIHIWDEQAERIICTDWS